MFLRCFVSLIVSVSAYVDVTPQVPDFSGVEITGPFLVRVNIDATQNVRIMAEVDDTNVTDAISTVVENDSLKIRFLDPYDQDPDQFAGLIRIYITTRSLPNLALDGSGTLIVDSEIKDSSVNVFSNGAGNISLQVYTPNVNIVLYGTGTVGIRGTANAVHVATSGAGKVAAENLVTDTVTVAAYGEGDVMVNTRDTLSVVHMGSGTIQYVGDPKVNVMSRGTGSVVRSPDERSLTGEQSPETTTVTDTTTSA